LAGLEEISIHPPVMGEWAILRPPGHHRHAFDFVQIDAKQKYLPHPSTFRFIAGRIPTNQYYCWNKPIFSPIEGNVIRVGNGTNDNEYTNIWKTIQLWYNATYKFKPKDENGRLDIRPNAGNHVMIQAIEGYIVFLAHMRNHSILVKEGDDVKLGQEIGRLGNSGNSTMPHLHINLFDQMDDPFSARVLPFVFDCYEILNKNGDWEENFSSLPGVGDIVKFSI